MAHEKTTIDTTSARTRRLTVAVPAATRTCRRSRYVAAARSSVVRRLAAVGALFATPALARAEALDSGDTAWMITATALVLFMTIPGLALLYGGLVRANSVLSVLLQCFAITCLVSVLWLVAGYSLAFGGGDSRLIGDMSRFLYQGIGENVLIATVPEGIFATFQLTFAIIAPALMVGAFVERTRFSSVLLFTAGWSLLVYAPVAHWIWGGGWLAQMGLLDYAGGTVVHVTAGTGALVAAIVLGPRQGFPETTRPPHSPVLALVGGAMLWVGCSDSTAAAHWLRTATRRWPLSRLRRLPPRVPSSGWAWSGCATASPPWSARSWA